MKKTLSLILAVLLLFSVGAMSVSAANLVTVNFVVDDVIVYTIETLPEEIFVDRLQQGEQALKTPVKAPDETYEYTFKYWECKELGVTATTGNIPAVGDPAEGHPSVITYEAVFAKEEIRQTQSFFKFLETIFARINMIFEYFAKVFEGVFDF